MSGQVSPGPWTFALAQTFNGEPARTAVVLAADGHPVAVVGYDEPEVVAANANLLAAAPELLAAAEALKADFDAAWAQVQATGKLLVITDGFDLLGRLVAAVAQARGEGDPS